MRETEQIIEKIRKIRFGIGLDTTNLTDDQIAAFKDKEKILKDASKLAKEIHTKNPHFIFELIQNAEDNEYKDFKPTIRFIIDTDYLIIQNNERGFDGKNVWALCGIGETTKTNKSLGYIGEKGIGFKSVFMVADKVHIYSNGFQFGFNYDEKNPVTMIIPEWIDEIPEFVDSKQTNIVLYLKPEIKNDLSKYIEEIHPSLLLFLRKLKVIEIVEKDTNKVKRMELHEKGGVIEIVYGERKSHWRVIKKSFPIPDDINEERRRGVSKTEIILAFPLKEDFSPDPSNEQFVFAFLPIRKYGFKFIIQADFLLPITREDIIKDNRWNIWLRDSIIEVFLDAVSEFKNDEKLKFSFYDYLPVDEVKDDFFLPVVEQIYEKLKKEDCILTEVNRWKKPSDVLIGDEEIRRIVTNKGLQKLLGKEYLSKRIKAKKSILSRLGVRDSSVDDLLKCLEKTEWIEKQDDEWFANLFRYLSRKELSDEQLERLKDLSILRLENGELTSINEGVVFFPLEKKVVYGFENELRVPKKEIIYAISKQEREEKDKTLEFLKRLSLKQADPYEVIENHILPIYEGEYWKQRDSRTLMGYIRYIKDNIDKYEKESNRRLNVNKRSCEAKEGPLKRLKKSLLIRINKDDDGEEWYDTPENMYLSKIYGNKNNFEELFEGIDVSFVHPCYLEWDIQPIEKKIAELKNKLKDKGKKWRKKHKKEVNKVEEQIAKLKEEKNKKVTEWEEFFLRIGMEEVPKIDIYVGSCGLMYSHKSCEFQYDLGIPKEEMEYSTRGHKVEDWRLSREFNKLLENLDLKKAEILLKVLDGYWNDKYSNHLKMDYHWFYYWREHKTLPSSFIRDLKEKIKIPTTQNTLAKRSEVFLNKPEIHEILGDTVPYLAVKIENEDFIKVLGINTQADVNGVLNYLISFTEQGNKDKEKFEKLYKFLDEHFEDNADKIKDAFSQNSLIFVPDKNKDYCSSRDVIWKDVSNIFGKNRIYLEKYYPKEFRKFFVEKIGISEKPTPKDYAEVLCSISEKDGISGEDKKIIVKIYEELNRNLNPDKVENPISQEDWWKDFIEKPIFLTNRDEFWSNDGNIFINDNNDIYEVFKDEEDIGFLWLPDGYHPDKIKFFIKACGLRYLSESVEIEPLLEGISSSKDDRYTQLIQTIIPYVLRYLYCKENAKYEKLKENRTLEKVGAIEVYVTKNLKVKYSIKVNNRKTINREAERKCIYHNGKNRIYMKSGCSIYDLAVEFSKVFGEIKGLDDFIMNIMNNISNAEDIMGAKNIGSLPESEEEILNMVSKVREIERVEKAEEEKELPESELEEVYSVRGEMEIEKTTHLQPETSSQHLSESKGRMGISTGENTLDKKEKEWTPEFSPKEVRINVENYTPHKEVKETETSAKEIKSSDKRTAVRTQVTNKDKIQPTEALSEKAKIEIGRWGEEYAFRCIKEELKNKHPDASLKDTEQGFRLEKNGNVVVEVIWLNKYGESEQHYDIKIIENGNEIFIEVKSTKEYEKAWFQVSKDQWRLMKEKGDKFYIYRVYGAGTEKAKIEKIYNPAKLWKEEQIDAYPIGIEI